MATRVEYKISKFQAINYKMPAAQQIVLIIVNHKGNCFLNEDHKDWCKVL